MRSALRVLTGLATTIAVTAAMVGAGITGAAAAPTKPVISQIVATGGTFTTSPAAGTELNPKVTVSGVLSGDVVSIYVDGGAAAATCTATATSVTFNKPTGSNCSVPATFNVGAGDGNYTLTADRVSGVAGQSPRSDGFVYIRDTTGPTAPASVTVSKQAGAAILVQFPTALDTAPFASGIGSYNVYRSQANPPNEAAAVYTQMGSVAASSCGSGSTACSYSDGAGSTVPPSNANTYYYRVTAVDRATNEGPKSPASSAITADGSPPGAPSGLTVDPGGVHDAGYGNNPTPTITVTLSGEASTIRLYVNNVVVNTQNVSASTTSFVWNGGGGSPVINLGADGSKDIKVTATDGVGNASSSSVVNYVLDTVAPGALSMAVSNQTVPTGGNVSANDTTPLVVISGAANGDHLNLHISQGPADLASVSDGNPTTYNPDSCINGVNCDFTVTGASPQNVDLTASVRDPAGNVGPSYLVHYTYDTTGPAVSTIVSMGSPADTSSPASGTDRTPPMVVRVSDDVTRVDIFRGAETSPLGSLPVSGHTVACSAVASTVCVGFNQTSSAHDFTVSAGANILKARAFDSVTNYIDSSPFEWDGTDTLAPPAPGKPTTVLTTGGHLAIDWNDVTDANDGAGDSSNPVTYDVQKASSTRASNGSCPDPATLTFTLLHTGLTTSNDTDTLSPAGNCYFYRVRAVDGAQNASSYGPASDAAGEAKPHVSGYVLDGNGGMHPVNGAAATNGGPYFNFDIARDVVLLPNGTGGFILDGYGGIHPFGVGANPKPPTPSGGAYFNGFDIARGIVLVTATSGYVLDGYGGVHPFGGAPALSVAAYFNGNDIARRLVMTSPTAGYLLDGYGATHPFGGAPAISGTPYYSGFDIARDLILSGPARGYELDGYGGIHPFGGAPAAAPSSYTGGSDIARTVVMTEPDLDGGLVLDAYGKVSTFGDAAPVPRPATFASPAGRRLVITLS